MLTAFLTKFLRDEHGAVTVDWVVLTAGILLFGVLAVSLILPGAKEGSDELGNRLGASAATIVEVRFDR